MTATRTHTLPVILLLVVLILQGASPAEAASVGPMVQMTGGGSSWWPSVCYNGQSDQYLVMWVSIGSDGRRRTTWRRVDAQTGELLGSDYQPYPGPVFSSFEPTAAYNSTNGKWLVVYPIEVVDATDETDVVAKTISSDGSQTSNTIDIAVGPGFQEVPVVAYNPTNDNYLVVWKEGFVMKAKLVSGSVVPGDSSKVGPQIRVSEDTPYNSKFAPKVAYNPVKNEYMVVWSDYRNYPGGQSNDNDWGDIYGQRINAATGALIGGNIPVYTGGSPYVPNGMDSPDIACNPTDGRYFIAVTKLSSAGWTTKGVVINYDGSWYSGLFDVSHPNRGSTAGVVYNPYDNTYFTTYLSDGYSLSGRQFSVSGQAMGSEIKVYSTPWEENFGGLAVRPSDGQYMQVSVLFEHLVTHSRPYLLVAQRFKTGADTYPPQNVEPFTAYRQPDGNVLLTWSASNDQDINRVMVRYRTDRYPTSPTDGTLVCDRPSTLRFSESYVHSGSPLMTCYYTAFSRDVTGNYSSGANAVSSSTWLNESFDTYGNSVLDAYGGWTRGDGKNSCQVQDAMHTGGPGKAVAIYGETGAYDDASLASFGTITGGYHKISFDMARSNPPTPGAQENQAILEVFGSGAKLFRLYWSTSYKILTGPGSTITELLVSPVSGQFSHVEIGVDFTSQTLDLWIDGIQKVSGKPFYQLASQIDRISLVGYTGATSVSYMDNLRGERISITSPPPAPVINSPVAGAAVESPYPRITWSGDAHDRFQVHINTTNSPDGPGFDSGEVVGRDNICDTGPLAPNRTYYAFVRLHNSYGWGSWSAAGHWFNIADDATPPSAPSQFQTLGSYGVVNLKWQNPTDLDLSGVVIRCRTDRYPDSQSDGTLVTTLSGITPGAMESYIHTGTANGVRYYYSIFAYDDARLYSVPAVDWAVPEFWSVEYHADAMPSVLAPTWTLLDDGSSESYSHIEPGGGVLHVFDNSTASGTKVRWYRDWAASNTAGSTVLMRAKCDSATLAPYSANLTLSDGVRNIDFVILPDRVASKTEGTTTLDRQYMLDGTVYHRYRFTLQGTIYACYVDEDPTPVFTGTAYTSTTNRIFFGTNGSTAMHSIYYDYLLYRTDKAAAPIGGFPQAQVVGLPAAKLKTNGSWVKIVDGVVSAAFGDFFYIQSSDGLYGLRVHKAAHGLSIGRLVSVAGTMALNSNFERYLLASLISPGGTGNATATGIGLRSLGGADLQYSVSSGQKGVDNGFGPNNIGKLVRTWGRVTEVDPSGNSFIIDDGSGPVKVFTGSLSEPSGHPFIIVTGIVSLDASGGLVRPVVLPEMQSDIVGL